MSDESNKGGIIPFSELNKMPVDLTEAVMQAKNMSNILSKMGIAEATFKTGTVYKDSGESQTVSGNNICVERKLHTTTVTFLNEGSTPGDAIPEMLSNHTQEITAAFVGSSQPTISNLVNKK